MYAIINSLLKMYVLYLFTPYIHLLYSIILHEKYFTKTVNNIYTENYEMRL